MTKRIAKFFLFLLAAVLLVYVGFQVYMIAYPSYKSQVALIKTVEDTVATEGIVVRNETVIEGDSGGGVYNYLVSNGDKVAKGATVAEIYATPQDALDSLMLSLYQEELEILKRATDQGRTAGTNLDSLTSRIQNTLNMISTNRAYQDYEGLAQIKLDLMELLNSYDVASGNELDTAVRVAELEAHIAELQARNVTPIGYLTAPEEGYFIASSDGMESAVNKSSVMDMSIDEIVTLTNGQGAGEAGESGKLVSDYVWYYVAVIDASSADRVQPGMSLMLDFAYSAVSSLPVKVVDVKTEEGSAKAVVIVECNIFNAALTELRFENASLSFRNYSGFIIDRSFLRVEDGVVGVYVKYGSTVQFRELDIIYETDTYVVSRPDSSNSNLLAMYDEIITQGRDLYVGKDLG